MDLGGIGRTVGVVGAVGAVGAWALGRSDRPDDDHHSFLARPFTDLARGAGDAFDVAHGLGGEAYNVLGHFVDLQVSARGRAYEPHGRWERSAADVVDVVGRALHLVTRPSDPEDGRSERPLLARARVQLDGGGPAQLTFAAATDAAWGEAGRESVLAQVFVDGHYVSDMPLIGERDEPYRVALGDLPAGSHDVELRIASGSPIQDPAAARVTALAASRTDQPLIDRYAPILEGRDVDAPGGRVDMASDDAPLAMDATVHRRPDGTREIAYTVLFSNEDGGTHLDELFAHYGRGTDYEPAYKVVVDADGNRVSDQFQGTAHHWQPFSGTREGDRPVLRVETDNNLYSQVLRRDGHRWSVPVDATVGGGTEHGSRGIMDRHPWTWTVMGHELAREDKLAEARQGADRSSADPRTVVRTDPTGAAAGAATLGLVLRDGRAVRTVGEPTVAGDGVRSWQLPDGVHSSDVASFADPGTRGFVVDDDFTARQLGA